MKNNINKIAETFDIPIEIQKDFYLEMYSENDAVLTGNIDITELGDSVIMVECGKHKISFWGSGLRIKSYTPNGIRINGKIEKIEFL